MDHFTHLAHTFVFRYTVLSNPVGASRTTLGMWFLCTNVNIAIRSNCCYDWYWVCLLIIFGRNCVITPCMPLEMGKIWDKLSSFVYFLGELRLLDLTQRYFCISGTYVIATRLSTEWIGMGTRWSKQIAQNRATPENLWLYHTNEQNMN